MQPEHLSGLEDLARLFTKMCIESPMGCADVYVRCNAGPRTSAESDYAVGTLALLRPRWSGALSVPPLWNKFAVRPKGSSTDGRDVIPGQSQRYTLCRK
jgi:hypothetical protein